MANDPVRQQRRATATLIPCDTCGRSHRSWYSLASCRWRRGLLWVQGDPPAGGPCWALVSFCRHPGYRGPAITVTLWSDLAEAQASKACIDRLACGGSCSRQHRIFNLAEGG
jgi:hypothetical protein